MSSRELLLEGGEFGSAVVPKDAENSVLIEMITSTDPDDQMPPKGERLSEAEFTRLQALEITNGDTLAVYLTTSAKKLLESGPVSTHALMYHAWGRSIPESEAPILAEYGESISETTDLEDVLWLIGNHPEFQIIF